MAFKKRNHFSKMARLFRKHDAAKKLKEEMRRGEDRTQRGTFKRALAEGPGSDVHKARTMNSWE